MPRFPALQFRRFGLSLTLLCGPLVAAQGALQTSTVQLREVQPTYTVKPGDTAYSVARLAGTDVATLLSINGLTAPDLHAGQVLRLPPDPAQGTAAFQTSAPTTTAPPRIHTVQPGQTLYGVARLYGLNAGDVQAFNHLSSPDLKPGQRLLLPDSPLSGTSAAVSPFGPPAPVTAAVSPSPVAPLPITPPPLLKHTVTPGQTLYAIARLYHLKAADLLTLNRLQSEDLRAGQVLLLPAGTVAPTPLTPGTLPLARPPSSAVPSGALLSPGVPLPASPLPGRPDTASPDTPRSDLPLPGDAVPDAVTDTTGMQDWRGLAMGLMGVPYQYGGQTRDGTDCSGLVLQVFGPLGLKLPRQSALQAQTGMLVQPADLQAGDLLFFDTEGRGTVTHVGIYLGEYQGRQGAFINANSYNGQVAVNQLSDRYFAQRYLWARRVLGVLAQGH